jgi:hypothetical protein
MPRWGCRIQVRQTRQARYGCSCDERRHVTESIAMRRAQATNLMISTATPIPATATIVYIQIKVTSSACVRSYGFQKTRNNGQCTGRI